MIGTVLSGQVKPLIVGGWHDQIGIVGTGFAGFASAGKQLEIGTVGIGQFTPGMVGTHDKVGNPASFGGEQVTPGIVAGGGQLINGIVFGIHEVGGIVGNDAGFAAASPPPVGLAAALAAGFLAGLGFLDAAIFFAP